MMIIDGRKIASEVLQKTKDELARLPFEPVFCDVLVGTDPASVQYVNIKNKAARDLGFLVHRAEFPETITTAELKREIGRLNNLKNICGLIVQLPLPATINAAEVLNEIDPAIDVDCTGKVNSEKFYSGKGVLEFPTAAAVVKLLESLQMDFKDKNFLVIGQGQLVGRPVAFLLEQKGLKPFCADQNTKNLPELLKQADVVITATGRPNSVTGEMLKPGAVVIDAGTAESSGGISGDAEFDSVFKVADFLTPVPGGVGPVTVAMLLSNVAAVAKAKTAGS